MYLADPFIYKFEPEKYYLFSKAASGDREIFERINKLLSDIQYNSDKENLVKEDSSAIDEYVKIFGFKTINFNKSDFKKKSYFFLNHLLQYRYFFKELAAALKFNPLSKRHPTELVLEKLIFLLDKYHHLIKPKIILSEIEILISEEGLLLNNSKILLESKKLAKNFISKTKNNKARVFIYVATIGPEIDKEIKRLAETGDVFDSYMLNGIGGAAAEMVADDLNNYFNDKNGSSKLVYKRYSPGYGDWNVSDQQKLFKILNPSKYLGVNLSEGFVMYPEKSTSGILGLTKNTSNLHINHSKRTI